MKSNAVNGVAFDDGVGGLSVRDVLTVLFKRRRLITICTVIAMAGVVGAVLLTPPTYVVTATLLVNKARADVPLAPTDSPQLITYVSEQDLNSEVEILSSRNLIEDVVRELLNSQPKIPAATKSGSITGSVRSTVRRVLGRAELSPFEQMVVNLSRDLGVTAVRRSNVIKVSFRSKDADWATHVVRLLTEKYIERRAERYQSPQVVSFFESQMRDAQNRLREREQALERKSAEAGVTLAAGPEGTGSIASQKQLLMSRLTKYENELADAETELDEQSRTIESLRFRLNNEPERVDSSDRDYRDSATEIIEDRITALELERDALLQDFKPDSRFIRDIEKQIDLANERLEVLRSERGDIDGTEVNPIYQTLKSELLQAEVQYDATRARADSLRRHVAEASRDLAELNDLAFEFEGLGREARAAEEEYLLYRKKHEEARISEAMDRQRLINVTIAQPAQKPLKPVGRGLTAMTLLGFLVGLAGGTGLAFVTDYYLDHSFTTGHELERRLDVPVIASITEGGA